MENGIIINGKSYPMEYFIDILDIVSELVADKLEERKSSNPNLKVEKNYTSVQISALVNKSVSTITRHLQSGLLKGNKVGRSWLITEENYKNYKFNTEEY